MKSLPCKVEQAFYLTFVIIVISLVVYLCAFALCVYVWLIRFYPPIRAKNPGLTIITIVGGFLWWISYTMGCQLPVFKTGPACSVKCYVVGLVLPAFGRSLFIGGILSKQLMALRLYVRGKMPFPPSAYIAFTNLTFLSVLLLSISNDTYDKSKDSCMEPWVVQWAMFGYQCLALVLCLFSLRFLRDTYYAYPNYFDTMVESLCLMLFTLSDGISLALSINIINFQLFLHSACIPFMMFFVVGRTVWKYYKKDQLYAADFDKNFGSLASISPNSMSAMRCVVNNLPHQDSSSVEGSCYEVDYLGNLVAKGNVQLVQNYLFQSILGLINEKDSEGSTVLHRAVRGGHKEMVNFLLDMLADPNATERDGLAPMHIAASLGNSDLVFLLANHSAQINAMTNVQGKTPLHNAVKIGNLHCVANLLALKANPNLCQSVDPPSPASDNEVTSIIRKAGNYSPNKSPFYLAVELGYDKIVAYMYSVCLTSLEINTAVECMSPLNMACLLGHSKLVELLLTMGANLLSINPKHGRNLLHYTCMQGSLETLQSIMTSLGSYLKCEESIPAINESSPDFLDVCQSPNGPSSFTLSGSYSKLRDWGKRSDPYLLPPQGSSYGTIPSNYSFEDNSDLCSNKRKYFQHILNKQDYLGRTPLHYAVLRGSPSICYMMVRLGADPGIVDNPKKANKKFSCHKSNNQTSDAGRLANVISPPMGWSAWRYAKEFTETQPGYPAVMVALQDARNHNDEDCQRMYLFQSKKWPIVINY